MGSFGVDTKEDLQKAVRAAGSLALGSLLLAAWELHISIHFYFQCFRISSSVCLKIRYITPNSH